MQRHVRACVGELGLAALDPAAAGELGSHAAWSAVVGREQHQGVVREPEARERVERAAHLAVHLADQLGIARQLRAGRAVGADRREVGQGHRVVGEERAVAVARHEVDQEVGVHVGAVAPLQILASLPVLPDQRLPVARALVPAPAAAGLEAGARRVVGVFLQLRKLPFAGDGSRVARARERVREGELGVRQPAPAHVRAERVAPGEERHARRVALRHGEAALEAQALARERVEPRCLVGGAAVGAEALAAEVVGQEDQEVRPGRGGPRAQARRRPGAARERERGRADHELPSRDLHWPGSPASGALSADRGLGVSAGPPGWACPPPGAA